MTDQELKAQYPYEIRFDENGNIYEQDITLILLDPEDPQLLDNGGPDLCSLSDEQLRGLSFSLLRAFTAKHDADYDSEEDLTPTKAYHYLHRLASYIVAEFCSIDQIKDNLESNNISIQQLFEALTIVDKVTN
jgi:hypothetical protein